MAAEKGVYRSVYSAIWDDPEFQAFDPTTQAVFFCLRTARDCNFPCIFVFYPSAVYERMPKATHESIDRAIDTLIGSGWIIYDRPILWIVKGLKNDPAWNPANPKQKYGVVNILRSLPKLSIISTFCICYSFPFPLDTLTYDSIYEGIRKGTDTGIYKGIDISPKQGKGTGTGKRLRSNTLSGKPDIDPLDELEEAASGTKETAEELAGL